MKNTMLKMMKRGILSAFTSLAAIMLICTAATAQEKPAAGGWRVALEEGKSTRATMTIGNRCSEAHSFRIKNDLNYLSFEEPTESILIAPGSSTQLWARFDATGLKSRVYEDDVLVECLDCKEEKATRCTQDRDKVPVILTVTKPAFKALPPQFIPVRTQKDLVANFNQMEKGAQKAGVSLIPGELAYAAGDGGYLVSTAIKGADQLEPQTLTSGTDLIFVYVSASNTVVPEGYYKVRLTGSQAQFIDSEGRVAATVEAEVEQNPIPGKKGAPQAQAEDDKPEKKRRFKFTLDVHWGKDGPVFGFKVEFLRVAGGGPSESDIVIRFPRNSNTVIVRSPTVLRFGFPILGCDGFGGICAIDFPGPLDPPLDGNWVTAKSTLEGDKLNIEFPGKLEKASKTIELAEDITVSDEAAAYIGVKTLTALKGVYNVDYANPAAPKISLNVRVVPKQNSALVPSTDDYLKLTNLGRDIDRYSQLSGNLNTTLSSDRTLSPTEEKSMRQNAISASKEMLEVVTRIEKTVPVIEKYQSVLDRQMIKSGLEKVVYLSNGKLQGPSSCTIGTVLNKWSELNKNGKGLVEISRRVASGAVQQQRSITRLISDLEKGDRTWEKKDKKVAEINWGVQGGVLVVLAGVITGNPVMVLAGVVIIEMNDLGGGGSARLVPTRKLNIEFPGKLEKASKTIGPAEDITVSNALRRYLGPRVV